MSTSAPCTISLERPTRALLAALALVFMAAAPARAQEAKETEDPFEPVNRVTSEFNRIVRGALLDPLVEVYRLVTPEPVQGAVSNAASNLSEPLTAASSLLQGDTKNAGIASQRFLINSTLGLGGIRDEATAQGLQQRREDLGQAMGAGGAEPGPHIVLPLIGPSNMRDASGDALGALANPLGLIGAVGTGAAGYADRKDDYNALTRSALDPYVVERDAYEQNRAFQVRNAQPDEQQAEQFPSITLD
jgi:phospholipid-binding lipoprotein MlaA